MAHRPQDRESTIRTLRSYEPLAREAVRLILIERQAKRLIDTVCRSHDTKPAPFKWIAPWGEIVRLMRIVRAKP